MTNLGRSLLAAVALGIPALIGSRQLAIGQVASAGEAAKPDDASRSAVEAESIDRLYIPTHMSGTVMDLWYLWALKHSLVPAESRVASTATAPELIEEPRQ